LEVRRRRNKSDRIAPAEGAQTATGRAIVIGPYRRQQKKNDAAAARRAEGQNARDPEARLDEATGLARAIDLEVVYAGVVLLAAITPATYIGKGKTEEIAGLVRAHEAELVVMDCALSPVQQRNLEKAWSAKVLDRTGLILEIFGRRARTREGALQVELAHLTYQKGRLVRSWTHLERQRGGFGFLGGPGETQIEADRRAIEERIARIERELGGVKRTRALHRVGRKRVPYPVVALVGYTNAGKSTLFNRLTGGQVLEADMLFATLDPTLRAVQLPQGAKIILSDTVGFISDLPTLLVAAFRATLEEVIEADVILHVRDIAHPDAEAQLRDVQEVLEQLGIGPDDPRIVELWNKVDLLQSPDRSVVENLAARADNPVVPVSALKGTGLDRVTQAIEARLAESRSIFEVTVAPGDGEGLSWLYRHAEVLARASQADGSIVAKVRVDPSKAGLVQRKFAAASPAKPRRAPRRAG
jgi:GTP-binding protein HflX